MGLFFRKVFNVSCKRMDVQKLPKGPRLHFLALCDLPETKKIETLWLKQTVQTVDVTLKQSLFLFQKMATDDAKKTIDVLANDMPELGVKMQIFSLSMRSLYAENSVSSSVKNGSEFIELRDETRNDAVAYLKARTDRNQF